jgi:hypothetical protein
MAATAGFHVAAFRVSSRMVFVVSSLSQPDVLELAQAMIAPIAKATAGVRP